MTNKKTDKIIFINQIYYTINFDSTKFKLNKMPFINTRKKNFHIIGQIKLTQITFWTTSYRIFISWDSLPPRYGPVNQTWFVIRVENALTERKDMTVILFSDVPGSDTGSSLCLIQKAKQENHKQSQQLNVG